jgi:hypothetical protein
MDRLIGAALGALVGAGWRRGVRGGSQAWIVAGLAAWLLKRVRSNRGPSTVFEEQLLPGETLSITHRRQSA